MFSIRQWAMSRWLSSPSLPPSPPLPSLITEAEVFYDVLCELRDAVQANGILMHYIGLSVPVWLTDTQASHIFSAAERAGISIMDLGHPPASVAASHSIDLCRVPTEYLPCQPERIMTLDLLKNALTVSVLHISPDYYLLQGRSYSVNHNLGATQLNAHGVGWQELTAWINNFAQDKGVTNLFLIGPKATHPMFYHAVQKSDIARLLREREKDSVPSERAVALGAAEMTKGTMERQSSDCLESDECEKIRDEADRLTGKPAWRVRSPHSEL